MEKKSWKRPEMYNLSIKDTEAAFSWRNNGVNTKDFGFSWWAEFGFETSCNSSPTKPGSGTGNGGGGGSHHGGGRKPWWWPKWLPWPFR